MRNQAFVLAAVAAVAIGCGGGGGGGNRNTTSGSTSGSTSGGMTVNLDPTYGFVQVNYVTGRGRATGDYSLEIRSQSISNGPDVDLIRREGDDPIYLPLESFTAKTATLNVPFGVTTSGRPNSLNYSFLPFAPSGLYSEASDGHLVSAGDLPSGLPIDLDARIRAFAGRTTSVLLRISGDDFGLDSSGAFTFNASSFRDRNTSTTGTDPSAQGRLAGRLSDFVRFPLANVPLEDRPDLRATADVNDVITNGASYVYFSGDNVALSNAAGGAGSIFQEVGDAFDEYQVGRWSANALGGVQGTYDLRDNVPDIPEGSPFNLVSIYGGFRDYNRVLSGGGTFEMIMFPNSSETYTFEGSSEAGVSGRQGDIVAIVRNGRNQITNIYFGGVDLGTGSTGTFELFPIKALGADPADPDVVAARITGTVSNYVDASGTVTSNRTSVRRFNFAFDSTTGTLPTSFASSGVVTVFRR